VNRSALAKVTDGLTDAFSPLTPIVNAASIFRILGLPTGLGN
jgi:polysaccharide export outer membrane protein